MGLESELPGSGDNVDSPDPDGSGLCICLRYPGGYGKSGADERNTLCIKQIWLLSKADGENCSGGQSVYRAEGWRGKGERIEEKYAE